MSPADANSQHDKMDGPVETMLKPHKDLPNSRTPDEQESIRRQIAATDKVIDALVYEPCALTEGEVMIIEGESR